MAGHDYRRTRFNKRTYRNQNLGPFMIVHARIPSRPLLPGQRLQRGLEDLVEIFDSDGLDGLLHGLLGLRELVSEVLERADRVLDARENAFVH